jgi:hypothetical protein
MGHRSGDAPSPLQQLREKILQAVPALPPELQKQLEVENGGPMGDRWGWIGSLDVNIDFSIIFLVELTAREWGQI